MAKPITICAGIDTGKRKLDVALDGSSEQRQVENTPEGYMVLVEWLQHQKVKRVGIEASGGYEQAVVAELRRQRFVVVVFQPAQVRAYAVFHLQRAKNDRIDAALIAACTAAVKKIHPRSGSPAAALCRASDNDRADRGGYRQAQEPARELPPRAYPTALEAADGSLGQVQTSRVQGSGGGDPQASRSRRPARSDLQRRRQWHADCGFYPDQDAEIGQITREQAAALAGLAPYDD